jgi:ABC-type nitrate/sulfonate/bicarbonate transport system permease component
MRTIPKWCQRIAAFALIVALWQLLFPSQSDSGVFLPRPSSIAKALFEWIQSGTFWLDVGTSAWRGVAGFILGCLAGSILGAFTGTLQYWDIGVGSVMRLLRGIPAIAILPLVILFIGINDLGRIFLVTWGCTFPVWVGTHSGVQQVDPQLVWVAQSFGANRSQILWQVVFKASIPIILTSMRAALGTSLVCLVAAEMAGASSGVAYRMVEAQHLFRGDMMLAALFVLGTLGFVGDRLFVRASKWIAPRYHFTNE